MNKISVYWFILGVAVWIMTVPILIGVAESPTKVFGVIFIWLSFPIAYAMVNDDFEGVGLTGKNLKNAILGMFIVSIIHFVLRSMLILLVPGSISYVVASTIQVTELLRQGQFGDHAVSLSQIPLVLFMSFLAAVSNELFYRGFIFTRLRLLINWQSAILISALLFGIYHYLTAGFNGFLVGILISIISGILLHRYDNVIAPVLFQFLQYIYTIFLFNY